MVFWSFSFCNADSPSQAHKLLALAPPPTVTEVTGSFQVASPTLESESAEHIFICIKQPQASVLKTK